MEKNSAVSLDVTPILNEMMSQTALLWCISEYVIPADRWSAFLANYEKKRLVVWLDFLKLHPDLIKDEPEFRKTLEKRLSSM